MYQISTIVDFINYISLKTGISIGGYDEAKVQGGIKLSIGKNSDDYNGVGRGKLNIQNLLILRDEKGAFGSPTSDSVRTSIDINTKSVLLVFFDFEGRNNFAKYLEEITSEANWFFTLSDINISVIK